MTLTFDQTGKMLSGYKIRYRPDTCCHDKLKSPTKIEVLIKADFLSDDKEEMDEIKERATTALNATTVLSQILAPTVKDSIKADFSWDTQLQPNVDLSNFNINYDSVLKVLRDTALAQLTDTMVRKTILQKLSTDALKNNYLPKLLTAYGGLLTGKRDSILLKRLDTAIRRIIQQEVLNVRKKQLYIPELLPRYDSLLKALQRTDTNTLNHFKYLFPIQLMIGSLQLDTSCMHFELYRKEDNKCRCLKADPGMVKLVFNIPNTIFSDNIKATDFQLKREYPMKKAAIQFLKELVKANRNVLPKLLNIEADIKRSGDMIAKAKDKLEEYLIIKGGCNGGDCPDITDRNTRAEKLKNDLIGLQDKLTAAVGLLPYNCTQSNCPFKQIKYDKTLLGCSPAITNWLAKMVWLNGDRISLNPFGFTLPAKLAKAKRDDKKSAQIRVNFYDSAIVHLEDRIAEQKIKNVATDTAIQAELEALIAKREKEAAKLANDPDATDKNIVQENKKQYDAFATTSQILYKGQWEPYESNKEAATAYEKDKLWLRHYYFNDETGLTRQKFHFTYPEDENVALMVHNVPGGTTISINEYYAQFKDSAAFTVLAGQAIGQVASLYASINGISPDFIKSLNGLIEGGKQQKVDTESSQASNYAKAVKIAKERGLGYIDISFMDFQPQVIIGLDSMISDLEKQPAVIEKLTIPITFPNNKTIEFVLPKHPYNDRKEKLQELVATIIDTLKNNSALLIEPAKDLCMDSSTLAYLTALQQLATSPPLIDQALAEIADTTALLSTFVHKLSDKEAPHQIGYKLQAQFADKDGIKQNRFIDSSYIKVGSFHYIQFTAGLAYTGKAGNITSVDTSGGGFKVNRDDDRFRLIAGIKIYPWGLFNLKDPSILWKESRWRHRISILAATGIPKPLENFYLGLGFDFLPGLTISSGMHLQQRNRYTIQNNQVIDRNIGYRPKLFFSASVDPALLVNAIKSLF